jgi:hypothetical protein
VYLTTIIAFDEVFEITDVHDPNETDHVDTVDEFCKKELTGGKVMNERAHWLGLERLLRVFNNGPPLVPSSTDNAEELAYRELFDSLKANPSTVVFKLSKEQEKIAPEHYRDEVVCRLDCSFGKNKEEFYLDGTCVRFQHGLLIRWYVMCRIYKCPDFDNGRTLLYISGAGTQAERRRQEKRHQSLALQYTERVGKKPLPDGDKLLPSDKKKGDGGNDDDDDGKLPSNKKKGVSGEDDDDDDDDDKDSDDDDDSNDDTVDNNNEGSTQGDSGGGVDDTHSAVPTQSLQKLPTGLGFGVFARTTPPMCLCMVSKSTTTMKIRHSMQRLMNLNLRLDSYLQRVLVKPQVNHLTAHSSV